MLTTIGTIHRACHCGGEMELHMHTLFFKGKVKIHNVPVYTCAQCSRYEPLTTVKRKLGELLTSLGDRPARQSVSLAEHHEWADLLREAFESFGEVDPEHWSQYVNQAAAERIDLLLDLYRFAADSGDVNWGREVCRRLAQLIPGGVASTK